MDQITFVNCELLRLEMWCCCAYVAVMHFSVHQFQLVPIYLSVRA